MKVFAIMATLLASLQLCTADFYIWAVTTADIWGNMWDGYTVYPSDPSCSDVLNNRVWNLQGDVSGNKVGVRCKGQCGVSLNVDRIEQLEMHWSNNPLYHWTLYKDRGHPYKMYGLNGKTYGECSKTSSKSFRCMGGGAINGQRKFHCKTQFTAAQIRAGKR